MSFLAPLYALGALAVAAPILFHLIRRSPKGEVPFSSLMFLTPSPPRLTRRSRLDNLLLLLLRAAALVLLAIAFARPFLRRAARLGLDDPGQARVAVLIDTSASMRRGDLWRRAKAAAMEVVANCRPTDQLALFAFDDSPRPLLGFAESRQLDPSRRKAVASGLIDGLAPGWGATDLGQALVEAVAAVEDAADTTETAGRAPRKVVLISDLQQGSRLEALGDFEWPSDVELELKTVADGGTNASLQRLADAEEAAKDAKPGLRVRVSNDPGARGESFELAWVDDAGAVSGKAVGVYVPPGESRVASVPRPPKARALRLRGDAHDFDNTLFVAPEPKDDVSVVYLGPESADDPSGLLYYLERVYEASPRRGVRVVAAGTGSLPTWEPGRAPALVVLGSEVPSEVAGRLRAYAEKGGTVLDVLREPGRSATLGALAGSGPVELGGSPEGRDAMLGEIAFDHPLFAPLAAAQFNDFTKIRFWRHRKLDPAALGEARVLARFDDGDAAVVEKAIGSGRLVVLASGWDPADGQLARSSKFVVLMTALLERGEPREGDGADYRVNDRVPLPAATGAATIVVRKPDGSTARPAPGRSTFDETDRPGVYAIEGGPASRAFAVNLDPREGRTAPLNVEALEQLGCRLAKPTRPEPDRDERRQLHNAELEGRQKLWRWPIVAALGILTLETLLAGRRGRSRTDVDVSEGPAS